MCVLGIHCVTQARMPGLWCVCVCVCACVRARTRICAVSMQAQSKALMNCPSPWPPIPCTSIHGIAVIVPAVKGPNTHAPGRLPSPLAPPRGWRRAQSVCVCLCVRVCVLCVCVCVRNRMA